ncbi:unnamed protein product [Lactuca saligna]|uniref:SWIM-type domain-containing protein n=1 Tax=Lactuca saligna TaxID=75948 RepID=A0AA35ZJB7_LACSI|nr:unnamed protein product [Lactuca saligna]
MGNGHGLTLISNQHKGLLEAVKERVHAAEHTQCTRHICANFMKKFKGQQFSKIFWYVVASTTQAKFEQRMNQIKKIEPLAYDHLMERDPKTWSKAFFRTVGNIMHMKMVYLRVLTHSLELPDLGKKTCGCRGWQLIGYPCVHAYAAISNLNMDLEDYVLPWLTTTMFCNACMYTIKPLNGSDMCPGKVKVELVQEVDVESDSDSEVQREPDSEVESYEVYFEEGNDTYEDIKLKLKFKDGVKIKKVKNLLYFKIQLDKMTKDRLDFKIQWKMSICKKYQHFKFYREREEGNL